MQTYEVKMNDGWIKVSYDEFINFQGGRRIVGNGRITSAVFYLA